MEMSIGVYDSEHQYKRCTFGFCQVCVERLCHRFYFSAFTFRVYKIFCSYICFSRCKQVCLIVTQYEMIKKEKKVYKCHTELSLNIKSNFNFCIIK